MSAQIDYDYLNSREFKRDKKIMMKSIRKSSKAAAKERGYPTGIFASKTPFLDAMMANAAKIAQTNNAPSPEHTKKRTAALR